MLLGFLQNLSDENGEKHLYYLFLFFRFFYKKRRRRKVEG